MYCKAGFKHISLEDCEHVVMQVAPKKGFELPEDFYSEEAVAARREENRKRYRPGYTRPPRKLAANEVWELSSVGGKPKRMGHGED